MMTSVHLIFEIPRGGPLRHTCLLKARLKACENETVLGWAVGAAVTGMST